jgi:hypothetical protein
MVSNDNGKSKLEKEVESSMVRKRLWLSNNDDGDDDSSDSLEEETEEEEVSSEELFMNQLNTSDEKLLAKCSRDMVFSNDGGTTPSSSEPCTPKVTGTLMRRAATKMTMTSGCR